MAAQKSFPRLIGVTAVKPFCPLYTTGPRECIFDTQELGIWENVENPEKVKTKPAAFKSPEMDLNVYFEILQTDSPQNFQLTASSDIPDWTVQGSLNFSNDKNKLTKEGKGFEARVSCKLKGPQSTPVPWAVKGSITWTLSVDKVPGTQKHTMPIEFYILSPKLPQWMLDRGIPLDMLRLNFLLPAFVRSPAPGADLAWPRFVINALFNNPNLWYENWGGIPKYAETKPSLDLVNHTICWMDLWLSDMNGLEMRHEKQPYAVNCGDLAAIAQSFIFLGLTQGQEIFMILVDPFGYIKPTRLIGRKAPAGTSNFGRDLCNNPFYGQKDYSVDMLMTPSSIGTRSQFALHIFLALKHSAGPQLLVFDACAGPEYGQQPLLTYLQNAIDVTPADHKTQGKPEQGSGVVGFALPSSFNIDRGEKNSSDLFDLMFYYFRNKIDDDISFRKESKIMGDLQVPIIAAWPRNPSAITATWTFSTKTEERGEVVDNVYINVFRYQDEAALNRAYNLRSQNVANQSEIKGDNPNANFYLDIDQGSLDVYRFELSSEIHTKQYFMLTIECAKHNWQWLVNFGHFIQQHIFDQPFSDTKKIQLAQAPEQQIPQTAEPKHPSSDDVNVVWFKTDPDNFVVKLGTRATLILTPDILEVWWRGFMVDSDNGCFLFQRSTGVTRNAAIKAGSKENSVKLVFLAQKIGADTIHLTLFGPNLDQVSVELGVKVIA